MWDALNLYRALFQLYLNKTGVKSISFNISPLAIIGIVCYMGSFLMYLNLIKRLELSFISPVMTGIVTLLTLIVGKVIFGEHVGGAHIVGTILIIGGVVIINVFK